MEITGIVLSVIGVLLSGASLFLYLNPNNRQRRLGVAIARELRYVAKREEADLVQAGVKIDDEIREDASK